MAAITAAHEVLFSYLCSSSKFPQTFALLVCCRAVCQYWRNAVQTELPMLRVLDFSGYEARVLGADVLRALEHVMGTNLCFNLRLLDLGGCHLLDGTDMVATRKPPSMCQGAAITHTCVQWPTVHSLSLALPLRVRCLNSSWHCRRALPISCMLICVGAFWKVHHRISRSMKSLTPGQRHSATPLQMEVHGKWPCC